MTRFRVAPHPHRVLPDSSGNRAHSRSLILASPSALARLRRSLWRPQPTQPGTRIILRELALGTDAQRIEERVNALYASCGCGTGALAVAGTTIGLVAWWAVGNIAVDRSALLVALGALVAAALGGKLVGIARSRALLFRLLWRLERQLTLLQERADKG
jgi:hypothetical protein